MNGDESFWLENMITKLHRRIFEVIVKNMKNVKRKLVRSSAEIELYRNTEKNIGDLLDDFKNDLPATDSIRVFCNSLFY